MLHEHGTLTRNPWCSGSHASGRLRACCFTRSRPLAAALDSVLGEEVPPTTPAIWISQVTSCFILWPCLPLVGNTLWRLLGALSNIQRYVRSKYLDIWPLAVVELCRQYMDVEYLDIWPLAEGLCRQQMDAALIRCAKISCRPFKNSR